MTRFSRWLSLFTLIASLFATAAMKEATANSSLDGERADPTRFEKAVAGLKEGEQALFLYERIERVEERKSSGDAKPTSVRVSRVFPAGTGIAHIALGPDAVPTNEAAYRVELQKLLDSLTWAAESGKPQREAYEKVTKKQKERADLIDQTRNAFIFTFLGQETRGDRTLSKFRMEPNPNYKPTSRSASTFSKVKGLVWLDDTSGQMARIQGDVTEDISFGVFLGKIYKGSHFMQERYEFAPGIWLPTFSQYDFDARKLFSQISIHQKTFASHYRRVGPPADAIPIVRAEVEKLEGASPAAAKQ
ncbi:MAG TPA: hypothetical protein VN025_18675 [Candidatus Dormibacteraeota bacterium]|jgi:hypothetical protein|nr:hypothetical protein [Candidatus Dormibacteraeota bacterium]